MYNLVVPQKLDRQREARMRRLLEALAGTSIAFGVYLGDQMGWYQALAESGPQTPTELATRTNTHAGYARQWLLQQAGAGLLAVENEGAPAAERRFALPPGLVEPLTNHDSVNALMVRAAVAQLPPPPGDEERVEAMESLLA